MMMNDSGVLDTGSYAYDIPNMKGKFLPKI